MHLANSLTVKLSRARELDCQVSALCSDAVSYVPLLMKVDRCEATWKREFRSDALDMPPRKVGCAVGDMLGVQYRGTSLVKNSLHLGPYGTTMPRALLWL